MSKRLRIRSIAVYSPEQAMLASDAFWQIPLKHCERRYYCGRLRRGHKCRYLVYLCTAQGSRGAPLAWAAMFGLITHIRRHTKLGNRGLEVEEWLVALLHFFLVAHHFEGAFEVVAVTLADVNTGEEESHLAKMFFCVFAIVFNRFFHRFESFQDNFGAFPVPLAIVDDEVLFVSHLFVAFFANRRAWDMMTRRATTRLSGSTRHGDGQSTDS